MPNGVLVINSHESQILYFNNKLKQILSKEIIIEDEWKQSSKPEETPIEFNKTLLDKIN